jgi:hypothetical protein
VAIAHRDYWFYIEENDTDTKLFYLMLRAMWDVCLAADADQKAEPILIIPVSR